MDPSLLIQTALNGLGLTQPGNETSTIPTNGTMPSTTATPPATPTDFTSILTLMLSFSALRDWVKLFVIGGAIETCRRSAMKIWSTFVEAFWITACFDERDESYNWILFWLSKHPKWKEARTVDVTTRSFGLNSPAVSIGGEEDEERPGRKLCYLPSFARTYSLWYKGHYISITRSQSNDGYYGSTRESLQIDILARSHSVLNELLLQAKKAYREAEEHVISIYVSESGGSWRLVASRPKRPLTSIVLDPGMKELLVDDARDFLQSKDWYAQRGIPFRRGYLLYGAPGSGKSSVIHSLAGELGLDVYIISLARVGLDDTTLSELISELPTRCIALMEDIDAAFTQGLTRDFDDDEVKEKVAGDREREPEKKNMAQPVSRVTLSGLLNALDGLTAQEGRILYATTNRYTALDPALCRPGRMDLHVEFKLASKWQARELFKCFYLPPPLEEDSTSEPETAVSSARPSRSESKSSSSASSRSPSPTNSTSSTLAVTPEPTEEKLAATYVGTKHSGAVPLLAKEEVLELADRFSDAIPEREFSMATLQGYLMSYKIRPVEAVTEAAAWVEKERAKKVKKGAKAETS